MSAASVLVRGRPVPAPQTAPPPRPRRPPRRRRARARMLCAGALVAACLLGVVGAHAVLGQTQLRLDRLEVELEQATLRHQQLELEVAQLEAPSRIVAAAERLGMVVPTTVTYLAPSPTLPARPGPPRATAAGPGR